MPVIKTYAVDIDGTLCVERSEWWLYAQAKPIPESIKKINRLKQQGHTIILYTSRFEEDRAVTTRWLKKHGVQYDKIVFNKLRADHYVDNNSLRMGDL